MGRKVFIGQENAAAIEISPEGKRLTWFVPTDTPDPVALYVSADREPPKLQSGTRGGVDDLTWVQPGHVYQWWIAVGPNKQYIHTLIADARDGFPLKTSSASMLPGAIPLPGEEIAAKNGSGPATETRTDEYITGIPNQVLAIGAAVLGVALLAGRK